LRPFLAPAIVKLEESPAEAMAYVIRWKGRRITLDGSAAIANGIFVNLEREFDSAASFEDMKKTMFNGESTIFKLLNVEEAES
jgi:hypothetical protein